MRDQIPQASKAAEQSQAKGWLVLPGGWPFGFWLRLLEWIWNCVFWNGARFNSFPMPNHGGKKKVPTPRLQILTIEQLLHREAPKMPPPDTSSFRRAAKEHIEKQNTLFT